MNTSIVVMTAMMTAMLAAATAMPTPIPTAANCVSPAEAKIYIRLVTFSYWLYIANNITFNDYAFIYMYIPSISATKFVIAGTLKQVLVTALTATVYSTFDWRAVSVTSMVAVTITSVDTLLLTCVTSTLYMIMAPGQVTPSHTTT